MIDIIDRTRAYASSLRSAERGWDWVAKQTDEGLVLEAREVSIEEAERDGAELLSSLWKLQSELNQDRNRNDNRR